MKKFRFVQVSHFPDHVDGLGCVGMGEWYYSKDGAQLGPVSEAELKALLANGTLDAGTAQVWMSGMADWLPAAQVAELAITPAVAGDSSNRFDATAGRAGLLPEVEIGSVSIDAVACFKRGFDLVLRNFGLAFLVMVLFVSISMAATMLFAVGNFAFGAYFPAVRVPIGGDEFMEVNVVGFVYPWVFHFLSAFMVLGLTRFSLNVVSGGEAGVWNLLQEGRLILRGAVGIFLFGIVAGIGFLLFIVPGLYFVARYGFFLVAMVDRNCGLMEAIRYSSRLTTNNRPSIVLMVFLAMAVALLGCLALGVGLLFAYPIILFAWVVAYRWMQYGYRAAMDHPGTKISMLARLR